MLNWETDSSRTSTQAWAKLWIYHRYRKEKNINYLHFEKRTIPYLKNKISFTQGCFVPSLKLAQWFWKTFLSFNTILLCNYHPPFFWTNLNPLEIRMICATFAWNWHIVFLRRKFLNVVNVFSTCHYHLPLERFVALQLYKPITIT